MIFSPKNIVSKETVDLNNAVFCDVKCGSTLIARISFNSN